MSQNKEKSETIIENGAVCITPKLDPNPSLTVKEEPKVQIINGIVMVHPPDVNLSKNEELFYKNLLKKTIPFLKGDILIEVQKAIES